MSPSARHGQWPVLERQQRLCAIEVIGDEPQCAAQAVACAGAAAASARDVSKRSSGIGAVRRHIGAVRASRRRGGVRASVRVSRCWGTCGFGSCWGDALASAFVFASSAPSSHLTQHLLNGFSLVRYVHCDAGCDWWTTLRFGESGYHVSDALRTLLSLAWEPCNGSFFRNSPQLVCPGTTRRSWTRCSGTQFSPLRRRPPDDYAPRLRFKLSWGGDALASAFVFASSAPELTLHTQHLLNGFFLLRML